MAVVVLTEAVVVNAVVIMITVVMAVPRVTVSDLIILPSVGSYSQMKRLVRNLTTKAAENR